MQIHRFNPIVFNFDTGLDVILARLVQFSNQIKLPDIIIFQKKCFVGKLYRSDRVNAIRQFGPVC